MSRLWVDGNLIELGELSDQDRAFVASRWAPTASIVLRAKWLEQGERVDGRAWILQAAGVLHVDLDLELSNVDSLVGRDGDLVVALLGLDLSESIAGPKAPSNAVLRVLPLSPPPVIPPVVRLATSPWRHNNRSPVAGMLFAADNEYWVQRNAAQASGFDEALVLDLDGDVARAGRCAVFARIEGQIVTPPPGSGAPLTPWRDLAIEAMGAVQEPLTPALLRASSGAVVVDEFGRVAAIGAVDELDVEIDRDLAAETAQAIRR